MGDNGKLSVKKSNNVAAQTGDENPSLLHAIYNKQAIKLDLRSETCCDIFNCNGKCANPVLEESPRSIYSKSNGLKFSKGETTIDGIKSNSSDGALFLRESSDKADEIQNLTTQMVISNMSKLALDQETESDNSDVDTVKYDINVDDDEETYFYINPECTTNNSSNRKAKLVADCSSHSTEEAEWAESAIELNTEEEKNDEEETSYEVIILNSDDSDESDQLDFDPIKNNDDKSAQRSNISASKDDHQSELSESDDSSYVKSEMELTATKQKESTLDKTKIPLTRPRRSTTYRRRNMFTQESNWERSDDDDLCDTDDNDQNYIDEDSLYDPDNESGSESSGSDESSYIDSRLKTKKCMPKKDSDLIKNNDKPFSGRFEGDESNPTFVVITSDDETPSSEESVVFVSSNEETSDGKSVVKKKNEIVNETLQDISNKSSIPPKTTKKTSGKFNDILKFQSNRDALTKSIFAEFNLKVFDNQLSTVEVTWSKRLTKTAGLTRLRKQQSMKNINRTATIELSTKIIDDISRLRATLMHEMCHAAQWLIDGVHKPPHGTCFKKWANLSMSKVGVFINQPIILSTLSHNVNILHHSCTSFSSFSSVDDNEKYL